MSLELSLKTYREQVDFRLNELLPSSTTEPFKLHEAMRYSCLAPGKRLRPALCLASSIAVGDRTGRVLDCACAIEMIHCFSLIHDDLPAIDDDDLRRGKPSCHKVYGDALAILAGDALFALAFQTVGGDTMLAPAQRAEAALRLGTAAGRLVMGELMDIEGEGRELSLEALEGIHRNKTAALFAASCSIGAIAGRGSEAQIAALERYGESIGISFQIADDILDETSSTAALGKTVGADRAMRKATYVGILGLEGAKNAASAAAQRAISNLDALPGETTLLRTLAEFSFSRRH